MEIKVIINSLPQPDKQSLESDRQSTPKPSLEERVQYAIECISCGHNKKKAIEFLQKARSTLEAKPNQTKEYQQLVSLVDTALADYGHYGHYKMNRK